jgi:hypothetical protein
MDFLEHAGNRNILLKVGVSIFNKQKVILTIVIIYLVQMSRISFVTINRFLWAFPLRILKYLLSYEFDTMRTY